MLINIPKNRTFETPYLKKKPGLQPAFRWLISVHCLALLSGRRGCRVCWLRSRLLMPAAATSMPLSPSRRGSSPGCIVFLPISSGWQPSPLAGCSDRSFYSFLIKCLYVSVLYLSALWFAISLFATLIMGSRLRRSDSALSFLWLAGVILSGNLIAIFTFGRMLEIFRFSIAGLCVWVVLDLPAAGLERAGQVTWAMTLMTTGLFLIYTFMLTAFSPLNPLSFIFALVFFFLEAITLLWRLAHMHESLDVVCRITLAPPHGEAGACSRLPADGVPAGSRL